MFFSRLWQKELSSPCYFGRNLDALDGCLQDLDSLDNCADCIYVIVRCLSSILEKIFSYLNDASYF